MPETIQAATTHLRLSSQAMLLLLVFCIDEEQLTHSRYTRQEGRTGFLYLPPLQYATMGVSRALGCVGIPWGHSNFFTTDHHAKLYYDVATLTAYSSDQSVTAS
jgi:hypothetical protein